MQLPLDETEAERALHRILDGQGGECRTGERPRIGLFCRVVHMIIEGIDEGVPVPVVIVPIYLLWIHAVLLVSVCLRR